MKTDTLFQSKLLTKGTVLTISAQARLVVNEENVNALFAEVLAREEQKENLTPWRDGDIVNWFKGKEIPAIAAQFESAIYRFTKTLSHELILDEAKRMGIQKIYTYTEALATVIKGILTGEVDENGTGIIAYFKVDGNDQLYRFLAWRYDDGQLDVLVDRVDLGSEFDAGIGACFSNN